MLDRHEHYRDSAIDYQAMSVQRPALDQGADAVRIPAHRLLIRTFIAMAFAGQVPASFQIGFFHVKA